MGLLRVKLIRISPKRYKIVVLKKIKSGFYKDCIGFFSEGQGAGRSFGVNLLNLGKWLNRGSLMSNKVGELCSYVCMAPDLDFVNVSSN